jgi:DNA-binding NarL/FixJ family response regulator
VLTLIADGQHTAEIAARLFLSPKPVARHVSAILAKLGVTSRTAAVREATRRGLLAENAGSPPAM